MKFLKNRIIPLLLIHEGGLVKTVKFKNPKYIGDPINAIRIFNDKEVDEIIVLDIEASKNKKEPNYNLIKKFASECFMPVCYGGGVSNIDHAKKIFSLGVEKISVQTSCLNDINIIKKLSDRFGSQSIVASVDIKKNWLGKYKLFSAHNNKRLSKTWQEYLLEIVSLGAGEILINSVDQDGTFDGVDVSLIKKATRLVPVPIIAAGGVGCIMDLKIAIAAGANGVGAGSFFVFKGSRRAVLISYPKRRDLETLFKT